MPCSDSEDKNKREEEAAPFKPALLQKLQFQELRRRSCPFIPIKAKIIKVLPKLQELELALNKSYISNLLLIGMEYIRNLKLKKGKQ